MKINDLGLIVEEPMTAMPTMAMQPNQDDQKQMQQTQADLVKTKQEKQKMKQDRLKAIDMQMAALAKEKQELMKPDNTAPTMGAV
jgi:hypothetical protein